MRLLAYKGNTVCRIEQKQIDLTSIIEIRIRIKAASAAFSNGGKGNEDI